MTKKTTTKAPTIYKIPVKGSLGLLAYGEKGLRAWRETRDKESNKKSK